MEKQWLSLLPHYLCSNPSSSAVSLTIKLCKVAELVLINWQAKPETVQKVCDIVRKQLALPPETELTPQSKFSALGADSLDTVRTSCILLNLVMTIYRLLNLVLRLKALLWLTSQVEIVMGLEEEFDISVEEESSENITTVQEAADLIEKLVQKKAEA